MLYFWLILALFVLKGKECSSNNNLDRSIHMFNSNGDIMQIQYASIAVDKSDPMLLYCHPKSGRHYMIGACRANRLILSKNFLHHRIKTIGMGMHDHVVVSSVGLQADRQFAMKHLKQLICNHVQIYGAFPQISYLCDMMSKWLVRGLFLDAEDGANLQRPLAVTCAMVPIKANQPGFFMVDPGGCTHHTTAAGIGCVNAESLQVLKSLQRVSDQDECTSADIVNALTKSLDDDFEEFECTIIDQKRGKTEHFGRLRRDILIETIRSYCKEIP